MTDQEVIAILDTWWKSKRCEVKSYIDTKLGVSKRTGQAFSPPSEEEVDSFLKEINYVWKINPKIDKPYSAEWFVLKYSQGGWRIGNGNPMKDWKATVKLWYTEPYSSPSGKKRICYCPTCAFPKDQCQCGKDQ